LAALTVSSGAYAHAHHNSPSIQGAHASVAGTSEGEIRKQSAEEARARWGTPNQDMQKNRDFYASTRMRDRGLRDPEHRWTTMPRTTACRPGHEIVALGIAIPAFACRAMKKTGRPSGRPVCRRGSQAQRPSSWKSRCAPEPSPRGCEWALA